LSQIIGCVCFLFILFEQHGICQTKEPAYKKYSTVAETFNHPVARLVKEWNQLTRFREFTDTTKQFKVRAQILDFTEESVTLRIIGESDTIIVPLEKLDPSHAKEVARLIVIDKQIPSELAKYKEIYTELKKNSVIFPSDDGLEIKIPVKDIIQLDEIPSRITPEHSGKMVIIEVQYKDLGGGGFELQQSSPSKMENGKYTTWRMFARSSKSSKYYDTNADEKAHKPTNKWGHHTRRLLMSRTLDAGKTITFLETRGDEIPKLRETFDFEKMEEQAWGRSPPRNAVLAYSDRTDTFVHNGLAYEISMPKELFFHGRRQGDYGLAFMYALTGQKGMDINEALKKIIDEQGVEAAAKAVDDLAFKKIPIPGMGDGARAPTPIRVFFHAYVETSVKQQLVMSTGSVSSKIADTLFKEDEISLINEDWLHFDNQFDARRFDLGLTTKGMWDVSLSKQRPKLSVGENVFNLTPPLSSSKTIEEKLLKEEEQTPEGIDVFKRYEAKRELCSKVGSYTINAGETDQDVEVIRLYIQKWSIPGNHLNGSQLQPPKDGQWVIRDDKIISLDFR